MLGTYDLWNAIAKIEGNEGVFARRRDEGPDRGTDGVEFKEDFGLHAMIIAKRFRSKEWEMHPNKVIREKVQKLTDLPNIGKTMAHDLMRIGIARPEQLVGEDPYDLYARFCHAFNERQDPCALDVLMSIVDFMNGGEPRVWWAYTAERKRLYGEKIAVESDQAE